MKVTVVSMMAAAHGRESITWTGDVGGLDPTAPSDQINERCFRLFNRVDESDARYLQAKGYDLPSLSVGDFLHWGTTTWRVEGMGFSRYTGSDEAIRASMGLR
jgi:hypothetical protein